MLALQNNSFGRSGRIILLTFCHLGQQATTTFRTPIQERASLDGEICNDNRSTTTV